jgi:hypothetical protein
MTDVGGVPEIARADVTLMENAGSAAETMPSLTLMTIFE